MLIIKSWSELFSDQLIPPIKLVHPNEVPELFAPQIIMGSEDYLNWMRAVTRDQFKHEPVTCDL
jgi:uncharacterized protein involved in tolerance to divalent cations